MGMDNFVNEMIETKIGEWKIVHGALKMTCDLKRPEC